MMHRTFFLFLLATVPAFAAGVVPEPVSYLKPIPGTAFAFVMLGDEAVEAKQRESIRAKFAELRAKYPKTGLYKAETAELVWAVDTEGYADKDWIFVTADGVHLVRLDGASWQTKDFASRNRLDVDEERKQLNAPAVSFFANGKLIRRHALKDVVSDPAELPHSPQHILWMASAVFDTDEKRFVLFTQDAHRATFDVATGELLAKEPAGLGNPRTNIVLTVVGVLMTAILVGWIVYLVRQRRTPVAVT